jgi:hypothetical protein
MDRAIGPLVFSTALWRQWVKLPYDRVKVMAHGDTILAQSRSGTEVLIPPIPEIGPGASARLARRAAREGACGYPHDLGTDAIDADGRDRRASTSKQNGSTAPRERAAHLVQDRCERLE